MKLLAFYLFCTVFGFYAVHKAAVLIGPYPLTDSRHSLAFYAWELGAGLLLLTALTGFITYLFDHVIDK